ncbi:MAG: MarR family transcriptional regulator [Desulfovibrionaceae bacterium]|jgi:DNA-binding MarR family transcriptional regulator|nr:MarR family transcriptional regulator [Desulfovibrionaceae bacterium]
MSYLRLMKNTDMDTAVTEFGHAVRHLVRRLHAGGAADAPSWTETAALCRLANRGPATTAELARAEGITPQSMRAVVAGLERKGFVRREPHPTDGRRIHLALTGKGAAAFDAVKAERGARLRAAIDGLSDAEQEVLFAASAVIRKLGEMEP